ncbi:mating type protein MAT1-1-1 [Tuber indicum]|uniref:MAT1-1-1 n=1 Tax=Tuber indicum TaxID=55307 RepID=W0CA62_9PEZI|nr:MAT1-1-1 [Tuber indicum]AHE80942.1 MAT1-1-1 [Tuber indicum]KAG0138538.1 mating type protein MAT1-1-1 [Tuber indicum]
MRNATLGCALYLSDRGYILMQDRIGCIWVQHENSPIIVQPPGGVTFTVSGELLPYDKWLGAIQSTVRHRGRVPLDPEVPYVVSVLRLYCGYYKPGQPWTAQDATIPAVIVNGDEALARIPPSQHLRALNPYVAQRSWISKYCNGYGLTQAEISNLTRDVWVAETNKYMWQNIASLYTAARDRGDPGLVLEEFIETELAKHGHPTTPEKLLREAGFVPKAPIDKEAADKAAARRKARAKPASAVSRFTITRVYVSSNHQLDLTEEEAANILNAFDIASAEENGDSQLDPHFQPETEMHMNTFTSGGYSVFPPIGESSTGL